MANVTLIGAQWGDEGKGKMVDWLSERADVVVRFQGGHNAGHTIVIDGNVYKLHLLPSGVLRPDKISFIGNGVVVSPWAFLEEVETVRGQGVVISPDNLRIAHNATLILPLHAELDELREDINDGQHIGTTRRGIGPAYEDRIGRRAVRLADLDDLDGLRSRLEEVLRHHNALRRGFGRPEIEMDEVLEPLIKVAPDILPYADDVSARLDEFHRRGKRILFEGAQGVMLDIDHGSYPYVTSSNVVAAQAAIGSGVGPDVIGHVLGITKAYTTRVGEGPFPTEQDNEIGQLLGERGHEFGVTTGRKRRCGWFDAVMARQAMQRGGIKGIALTKLDVLDGMKELKVCTAYRIGNREIDHFPASAREQAQVEPMYETFEGWTESTEGARSWAELPAEAVKYIRRIEELVGVPVSLLSTSPERDDTIMVKDPFED